MRVGPKEYALLARPPTQERFLYFWRKSFVDENASYSYCSSPLCGNAVRYQSYGGGRPTDVVECTCGTRFCFACGQENHNPASCTEVGAWGVRNESDEESLKLIRLIAKPCFHCARMTDRVSGCNHMTCRKTEGGCGGEWCWMCGGDWVRSPLLSA